MSRGCGSFVKRRAIKEIVCKENLAIVVIQEVKKEFVNRVFIGSLWRSKFKDWVLLPSVSRSRGILMIWDVRCIQVLSSLTGDFSTSIEIKHLDGQI